MEPSIENTVESSTSCLEVRPLKTLTELLHWQSEDKYVASLTRVPHLQQLLASKRNKTLVCHDMKGGYLEDRFTEGCLCADGYRFFHWSGIDYFVYFSHYFITIPPIGWTGAAHRNGVPMLGTLITEGDEGIDICKELFGSLKSVEVAVQQLVNIAMFYKFEGWLINIENTIDAASIGLVIIFLQKLTQAMRLVCSNSFVIWYDSVTNEGKLKWQDELNDNNSCFYGACDAVFLNYSWKELQLKNSVNYARKCSASLAKGVTAFSGISDNSQNDLPSHILESLATALAQQQEEEGAETKVFVGVDVFGRSFYEGGGLNTYKAMELIRSFNLSAAIFAPGWTLEVLGCENFYENDCKFWRSLLPYLHQHGPCHWPVTSDFCDGCTSVPGSAEEEVKCSTWYNLSNQNLLPELWKSENGTGVDLSRQLHGKGSTCLLISNNSDSPTEIRLWSNCALPIDSKQKIKATVSFKDVHNLDDGRKTTNLTGLKLSHISNTDSRLVLVMSEGSSAVEAGKEDEGGYFTRSASCFNEAVSIIRNISFAVPALCQLSVSSLSIDREE